MRLLERETYLEVANELFEKTSRFQGHNLFISGEGGIGKSSLINCFVEQIECSVKILKGGCDFLFTPIPLGPLYDMAPCLSIPFNNELLSSEQNKNTLFNAFINELKSEKGATVLVFEDVHWADEATLDLIKFLSRRIHTVKCLLIVSYRENEILHKQLFKTILGEIPSGFLTKLRLKPLSEQAVKQLAQHTEHDFQEVFKLTKGNPFYVTEILAHYSEGIPENIKDTVLNVFYKKEEGIRRLWEMISIFPGRVNYELIESIEPDFYDSIEKCIVSGELINDGKYVFFKHELFRTAIENELSSLKKIRLNQKVLNYLLSSEVKQKDLSLVVHFAKNSQNGALVERYAPLAAEVAATQGSHMEASKLYLTALEYNSQGYDENLALLFEKAAYECYLTNQTKIAIEQQTQALEIWRKLGEKVKMATSLRFLSRLNWFEGNKAEAERFGLEAIQAINSDIPKREQALAYSNYSQLKMLAFENDLALEYGNLAVKLAEEIGDNEILSHAYNNIGTSLYLDDSSGLDYLNKSLHIAEENKYYEHVARAHTNIISIAVDRKDYDIAINHLNKALVYCDENDLHSWTYYMLIWKARYHFEIGEWDLADSISRELVKNESHPPIVRIGALTVLGRLLNRKGDFSGINYIQEAIDLAINTGEIQRVHPLVIALLEYEWITKDGTLVDRVLPIAQGLLRQIPSSRHLSELAFWLRKTERPFTTEKTWFWLFEYDMNCDFERASEQWKRLGAIYEYALSEYEQSIEQKFEAIKILDELGAQGVVDFLKQDLRSQGIKKIPRGPRAATRKNPAHLTRRQVQVLELLQDGLTNMEIADTLFISAKTVDHHVSAILSKLDVNTRQRAVAEAQILGIL
ncbi:AAA family ATPase [Mangrovimonas sp. CR14]|uniref:helix-turn-helix domain-containing protein n=1 Tax=Mangrovimonas sp. CR14 TaxID=2706120 RepID=UPI001423FB7F|nr:helix-turn-helix transcriptional regulator [Mangrovimonas sp. CR14]NIK92157.1 AAA family ATPase [Mangrovimonas sp. CR14]